MKKSQSLILFSILLTIITFSTTMTVFAEKTDIIPTNVNPNLITRGTPAVDFTAKDVLTDISFTFSSLAGKVIVLDFFSTTCIPCVHSVPELLKANIKYSSADFEIVSVDVDSNDTEAAIENFAEGWTIDWKMVRDNGDLANYYQLLEIPTFYIIDQDMLIYQAIFGSEEAIKLLDSFILELLPSYSTAPNPTVGPGNPVSEFWAKNWYWFILGGVMFIVVTGLLIQRRRIVIHNKKVRKQKQEARQKRYRKRER